MTARKSRRTRAPASFGPRLLAGALLLLASTDGCAKASSPTEALKVEESAWLQRIRQVVARIPETLAKNYKTFDGPGGPVSGFGAGNAYPQVWLRDSSWVTGAAAAYYPEPTLTSWLDLHLAHASKNGRLRDWVAVGSASAFREWAPRAQSNGPISFDTNSNESDQESSAALALCRAEEILGSGDSPDQRARLSKVIAAMDALVRDRTDSKTGLIWSGLTADWGDVSPLYPDQRAIYLDAQTPRTLSLYTNVMAYAAFDCLRSLQGPKARQDSLAARATRLGERVRAALWMKERGYFRIRRALNPLPKGFGEDDDDRFALGGNALAALFGVADDAQAASIFETAERLRVAHKFSTISTVLVPPYAAGVFQHPAMREPFQYQNGGQWDWFGAALVEAEFKRGHAERARIHLDQIASRILAAGAGLNEWYGQDGAAQGSPAYAASAAALYNAVVKGLLGVSHSSAGYQIVIRSGETLRPFEVPLRAAAAHLTVSQTVTATGIDVAVQGTGRVREVCSALPAGREAADPSAVDTARPQSVRRIGGDTLICADVSSSPMPIRARFAMR